MADPFFLSYRWEDGEPPPRVVHLDRELRLRGVPMWRDVRDMGAGGLNEETARRALESECSGCVLYFTEPVLESWFINSVELAAVKRRLDRDQNFFVAAVFDGTGAAEAEQLRALTGIDVGSFQGLRLDPSADAREQLASFSASLLERYLSVCAADRATVRVDSWSEIPHTDEATLQLNWAGVDTGTGLLPAEWDLLKLAVADLRGALGKLGQRRLELSGNLHLAAAFLLGWEFREPTGWTVSAAHPRTPVELKMVAGADQDWRLVTRPSQNSSDLLVARVCVSADPSSAVHAHRNGLTASRAELSVFPPSGDAERTSLDGVEINGLAAAIVGAIRAARDSHGVARTDLYMACPWTLALALGWNFASTGSVVVHEATADKATYQPTPLHLP